MKNLEVVILLHNSIQFVQFTTDTKTAQSVILSLPCLTAGSLAFTPPHIPLVIVEKYSIPSSPGHQTCIQKAFGLSTWQLQISFKLEGVNFGAGASFLDGNILVHGDLKLFTVENDAGISAISSS